MAISQKSREIHFFDYDENTLECRYNAVIHNMISHSSLQEMRQNINYTVGSDHHGQLFKVRVL